MKNINNRKGLVSVGFFKAPVSILRKSFAVFYYMKKLTIKEAEDIVSEIQAVKYDIDVFTSLKLSLCHNFILSVSNGLYTDQNEMQVVGKTIMEIFDIEI